MSVRPIDPPVENGADTVSQSPYQAPAIETVLTAEDLAREVLYAGTITNDGNALK